LANRSFGSGSVRFSFGSRVQFGVGSVSVPVDFGLVNFWSISFFWKENNLRTKCSGWVQCGTGHFRFGWTLDQLFRVLIRVGFQFVQFGSFGSGHFCQVEFLLSHTSSIFIDPTTRQWERDYVLNRITSFISYIYIEGYIRCTQNTTQLFKFQNVFMINILSFCCSF